MLQEQKPLKQIRRRRRAGRYLEKDNALRRNFMKLGKAPGNTKATTARSPLPCRVGMAD